MEDTTTVRPATAQGSSTAELVKHLSEQIGKLARDEVRLAQLEMMRAGKRAGLGIGAAACWRCTGLAACWLPRSSGWPRLGSLRWPAGLS